MTQEEKAKRYDEAYKVAENIHRFSSDLAEIKRMEEIFPELAESEDERIRKQLIEHTKWSYDEQEISEEEKERWISWLEKQAQKPANKVDLATKSYITPNSEFFQWIYDRLIYVHHENPDVDYMLSLKERIEDMEKPTEIVKWSPQEESCICQLESLVKEQWRQAERVHNSVNIKKMSELMFFLKTLNPNKKPQGKSALEAAKEEKVDNQNCVKPADKVEPKFHEGDWITDGEKVWKIGYIEDDMYIEHRGSISAGGAIKSIDKHYHLWTIQDAKDGDVLAFDDNTIVIFKDLYNATTFHSYCHIEDGVFTASEEGVPDWWEGEGFYPATKEQRDTLLKAIADAGYTFDFEKKELKKIESRQEELTEFEKAVKQVMEEAIECGDTHNLKADVDMLLSLVPKFAWSGKDEEMLKMVIKACEQCGNEYAYYWLKSLKERVQPKQEWNEEDKNYYDTIIAILENTKDDAQLSDSQISFLKSLRPQNTWKPSEEMLEALYRAIPENTMAISEDEILLDKLYQGLKYGRVLSNK